MAGLSNSILSSIKKCILGRGVVAHALEPRTGEAKAGGTLRLACSMQGVPSHPGQNSETPSQTNQQQNPSILDSISQDFCT